MGVLERRLYKTLLVSLREITKKKHAAFLAGTLQRFTPEIEQMSCSELIQHLGLDYKKTLKQCFRTGSAIDARLCMSMMPELLRYLRAAKIIDSHSLGRNFRTVHPINSYKSCYNMMTAAMLISRLYYHPNEREGTLGYLDYMLKIVLQRTAEFVRRNVNLTMERQDRTLHLLPEERYLLEPKELRQVQTYHMMLVLDRLTNLWSRNDFSLVKSLFPAFAMMPIPLDADLSDIIFDAYNFSANQILFCQVISDLSDYGLEAYGALINGAYYMKIVRRPLPTASTSDISAPHRKEMSTEQSFSSNLADEPRHKMPAHLLNGHRYFTTNKNEVVLRYRPETQILEAVMDSESTDTMQIPKGQVIWRVSLSENRTLSPFGALSEDLDDENHGFRSEDDRHMIYFDADYEGEELPMQSQQQIAGSYGSPDFHQPNELSSSTRCFLRFKKPPTVHRLQQMFPHLTSEELASMHAKEYARITKANSSAVANSNANKFHQQMSDRRKTKKRTKLQTELLEQEARVMKAMGKSLPVMEESEVTIDQAQETDVVYTHLPRYVEVSVRCERISQAQRELESELGQLNSANMKYVGPDRVSNVDDDNDMWELFRGIDDILDDYLGDDRHSTQSSVKLIVVTSDENRKKSFSGNSFVESQYCHVNDLDGAWFRCTKKGFEPVLPSSLFPDVPSTRDKKKRRNGPDNIPKDWSEEFVGVPHARWMSLSETMLAPLTAEAFAAWLSDHLSSFYRQLSPLRAAGIPGLRDTRGTQPDQDALYWSVVHQYYRARFEESLNRESKGASRNQSGTVTKKD